MLLNGLFKGEIAGKGRLEIGEAAQAEGRIQADELIHRGRSQGDLRAGQRLELGAGSLHRGDIQAPRVRINPRARLEGALWMPDARPDPPLRPEASRRRRKAAIALLALLALGAASSALSRESTRYFQAVVDRLDRLWEMRADVWFLARDSRGPGGEAQRRQEELIEEALRLEGRGALPEAAARLEQAAGLKGPRTEAARFRLAKTLARLERAADAAAQLELLLKEAPGHIEGRILLGDLHSRAGRLPEAARAYREAALRDPEDVILRRRLEGVQARLNPTSKPAPPAPAPPPTPEVILAEAERHLAEKRSSQAANLLRRGVALHPRHARLHFQLGAALAEMGSQFEAVEAYQKVVELAPDWLDAYVRLGALLEAAGRDREAIALYEGAGKLDRANVDMFVRIARLHKVRGRRNVAYEMLLKLREEHPGSVAVLLELGSLLWESGRSEESKEVFRKVLEIDPDSAPAMNRLAWFNAIEEKNLERGIELSKKSLDLQPDTPAYLDTLAELYFRSGQPVEAIPPIQRAIELDPNNRYYRLQLEKFKRASR